MARSAPRANRGVAGEEASSAAGHALLATLRDAGWGQMPSFGPEEEDHQPARAQGRDVGKGAKCRAGDCSPPRPASHTREVEGGA